LIPASETGLRKDSVANVPQVRQKPSMGLKLSDRWIEYLLGQPETGMGYYVVTLNLRDGRTIPRAVIDSGYVTRVKDKAAIDFTADDIIGIEVTHDKWRFEDN
jgi:hypothetical protein